MTTHANADWIANHSDAGLEHIAKTMLSYVEGGELSLEDEANCARLLALVNEELRLRRERRDG